MSEQIGDLAAALAAAQGEIEDATKDRTNPHFKAAYATLSSVLGEIRPALSKHGLSLAQWPGFDDGHAYVVTILAHSSGQWMRSTLSVPVQMGRGSAAQAVGSALSYLRRYSAMAAVGIAQEDDDGAAAGGTVDRRRETPDQKRSRQAVHHKSFTPAERAGFCASLKELKVTYDEVAAFNEAHGRPRPSQMDPIQRAKLSTWLHEDSAMTVLEWHAKRESNA